MSSATLAAQAATFAWTPLLTRLYDPAAFGALSVFISFVMPLSLCSALRLEQAIVLTTEETDASILFIISCTLVATVAACAGLVAALLMPGYLHPALLVAGTIAAGLWQPLVALCSRQRAFKATSGAHIIRVATVIGCQAFGALAGAHSSGLIIGYVCGEIAASGVLTCRVLASNRQALRVPSLRTAWQLIRRHKDFAVYSAPQTLVNTMSQSLPAFLLAASFGPAVAGAYWLAVRVLVVPSTVLTQAFRQVYYEYACRLHRGGLSFYPTLRSVTLALSIGSCVVVLGVVVGGPNAFRIVFGEQCVLGGHYAALLVPWTAAAFANLPSVSVLPILGRQRFGLCFDVTVLAIRTLALVAGVLLHRHMVAVGAYSGVGLLSNLLLILAVFQFTRRFDRHHALSPSNIFEFRGERRSMRERPGLSASESIQTGT